MAAIYGYTGTVAFAAGIYANTELNVRSWNLDYVADVLDTTDFSVSGDRTFIGGLRTWSGTFECLLDDTTTPVATGKLASDATLSALTLTASASRTYVGDAFVSGIHPSVSADGVNVFTADFQGSGALTLA